jgi:hypothetical protein
VHNRTHRGDPASPIEENHIMSTIHQPVHHHHHHTGLYFTAAAIVLGGLLAVLMAAVFSTSSGSGTPTPDQSLQGNSAKTYRGPMFREVCFAHRPGQSIDLSGPGCVVR